MNNDGSSSNNNNKPTMVAELRRVNRELEHKARSLANENVGLVEQNNNLRRQLADKNSTGKDCFLDRCTIM